MKSFALICALELLGAIACAEEDSSVPQNLGGHSSAEGAGNSHSGGQASQMLEEESPRDAVTAPQRSPQIVNESGTTNSQSASTSAQSDIGGSVGGAGGHKARR